MKTLHSERLILKPADLSLVSQNYLSWLKDYDVTKYMESPQDISMDALKKYVNDKIVSNTYFWFIFSVETNQNIGNIKLEPINNYHRTGTLGIMIGDKNYWNKGFGKEAIKTLLDYSFQELNLRKINLGVVLDNLYAVKLYKKLGFKIEGRLTKQGYYAGKLCDTLLMAIFREDYDNSYYTS